MWSREQFIKQQKQLMIGQYLQSCSGYLKLPASEKVWIYGLLICSNCVTGLKVSYCLLKFACSTKCMYHNQEPPNGCCLLYLPHMGVLASKQTSPSYSIHQITTSSCRAVTGFLTSWSPEFYNNLPPWKKGLTQIKRQKHTHCFLAKSFLPEHAHLYAQSSRTR